MIKVMVVDDHDLVRAGIARMLNDQEGIRVVGQAGSGEEAITMAKKLCPDVVLMDIKMPGIGGMEATRRMLRHDDGLRVIAVTVCEEEPFPTRLIQAGAAGYLTKGADLEEMLRAIRTVNAGQRYICPDVAQSLALHHRSPAVSTVPLDMLSERELQIMIMIVNCHKVQEVADQLCLSPKTVNSYRYRIFDKLGIDSDVEMAWVAARHNLVDAIQLNLA